ncbi:F-box/kelch-repeat protein At3g06240-like [Herrania umbratica]|uniref:F-box/kelch-repeat protein At3g06240-like n=1 Tax=Herrania umbratica TaxID=108875 RepID=A0A6J1AWM6_9ROSI|nr:F-box/kelch-repeat protein At3g06240-like [Herrania umbratica]
MELTELLDLEFHVETLEDEIVSSERITVHRLRVNSTAVIVSLKRAENNTERDCGALWLKLCSSAWHLVLWNPSTGDSKTLPDYYDVIPVPAMWNCIGGLGYDPSPDDYKVFLSNNSLFAIFSLRKNSWRRMQLSYGPCVYTNGIYSNGALHWKNYGDGRIFGFDLETETFYLVPGPDLVDNDALHFQRGTLFEVGGERLGVGGSEFWMMKKYGVKESWTRIRNTPEFDEWPRIWNSFKCLSENNDFIILGGLQQEIITHNANGIGRQIENTVICTDPIASWCRDWKVRGHPHRREEIAYTESLILPHLAH